MKKIILSMLMLAIFIGACNEEELLTKKELTEIQNQKSAISLTPEPVINSVTTTNTTLTVNWTAGAWHTTGHIVTLSENPDLAQSEYQKNVSNTASNYTFNGLPPNTTYYVRVISVGINRKGGEAPWYISNIVQATTGAEIPTSLPATNTTTNGFIANWEVVTEATSYDLTVYNNNGAAEKNYTNISNNWKSVTDLSNVSGQYSYKVKSNFSNGFKSEESNPTDVYLDLISPDHSENRTVTSSSFTYHVINNIENANIRMQLYDNASFSGSPVHEEVYFGLALGSHQRQVSDLASGRKYWVRIRTEKNLHVSSSWFSDTFRENVSPTQSRLFDYVYLLPGIPQNVTQEAYSCQNPYPGVYTENIKICWDALEGAQTYSLFDTGFNDPNASSSTCGFYPERMYQNSFLSFKVKGCKYSFRDYSGDIVGYACGESYDFQGLTPPCP